MNQKVLLSLTALTICSLMLATLTESTLTNGLQSVRSIGVSGIGKTIKKYPILAVKKAILAHKAKKIATVAALPLAIAGKTIVAAKLAVPIGIGAAIGAPVGAIIGAKAGAIKGALVGKALLAAKVALAKKAITKATAIAVKPVVFVAGAKAKIAGAKFGLIGRGVSAVGSAIGTAGKKITTFSEKVKGLTSNLAAQLTPSFPTLPTLPQLNLPSLPTLRTGPTSMTYSAFLNGPGNKVLGSNSGSLFISRRRREAKAEANAEAKAEAKPQSNSAQQLLQLVNAQNAHQCLQRVICELSSNPNAYGNEGIRFGRSLIQMDSQTDRATTQLYRQAATAGARVTNSQQCIGFFPTCAYNSDEVIRLGNQMIGG